MKYVAMNEETLTAAVIGLGGFGRQMADALADLDGVRLAGVADRDARRAESAAAAHDTEAFSDNRQLLMSARPDALFLATPPMAGPDLLKACLDIGIHVWKETPLGRNLEEAAAFARRFDAAGLKLAVGTQRRFLPSYRRARELRTQIGEVFLARGHYLFDWGPELAWRADRKSSGGGAMLELGYHLVDLLTWTLGLPEQVFAATVVNDPTEALLANGIHEPRPPHNTDDSATAVLRYKSDAMVNLVASRVTGPASEQFCLHGRAGSITADAETCILRGPDGTVRDHLVEAVEPAGPFRRQAETFLSAIGEQAPRYACSARENLLTHAVIDAIYLSAHTGQPESPLDSLHTHGLQPTDCFTMTPRDEEAS
ncbi:MAG: Gfo/Idh/MocA family oxidoreductase [Planctomycetes bacterium]|nr:Gfo/Idh/MocA family oxidoreductase [Planctomycetota bacterium]